MVARQSGLRAATWHKWHNRFPVHAYRSAPPNVTCPIDGAVKLIQTELPAWGWNCGCFEHKNCASLYVPAPNRIRANLSGAIGSRPEDLRLLQDPKWGTLFDTGFH